MHLQYFLHCTSVSATVVQCLLTLLSTPLTPNGFPVSNLILTIVARVIFLKDSSDHDLLSQNVPSKA